MLIGEKNTGLGLGHGLGLGFFYPFHFVLCVLNVLFFLQPIHFKY
jgi:hypothetical protein